MNQLTTSETTIIKSVKAKTAAAFCAVIAAVALPEILHALGAWTGLGTTLGETLLPMHFAIIIVGLLAGSIAGAAAGAVSPLISFAISGMPVEAVLPFMVVELAGYGLVAGLVAKSSLNPFLKLLTVQVGGRVLRAAALVISLYAFGKGLPLATIWTTVTVGFFGIVLQWALIPLITKIIEKSARNG